MFHNDSLTQQSWQNEIEPQPTSSLAKVTAAQNTDSHQGDVSRHPVAQGTTSSPKQAFTAANARGRKEATAFPAFHSKNAPVKVSVTGEWALKECEVLNHSFIKTSLKLYKHALCLNASENCYLQLPKSCLAVSVVIYTSVAMRFVNRSLPIKCPFVDSRLLMYVLIPLKMIFINVFLSKRNTHPGLTSCSGRENADRFPTSVVR